MCHTNHPEDKAHGGTAIFIRTTIAFAEQLCYAKPELQATIIQVQGPHRHIKIASVYCPPRFNLKAAHFDSFFQTLGPCFIAGGDFNSKHTHWGSRLITTKGRELAELIQTNNYSILSTVAPTYWPTDTNKLPDLLDFFILYGLSTSYADIKPSYDLSSDHTPVIITLSTTIAATQQTPRLHNLRTDWHRYQSEVHSQANGEWKFKTREDIDTAVTTFTTILQQAARLATPATNPHGKSAYLPSKIKRLVALKRKARATWQKTHAPEDRRLLNNATNKLKAALRTLRNENFSSYVLPLGTSDHSIWKPIKSRRKPQLQVPPIRKDTTPPGPWAKSDDDKVQIFASHLAEVYTPHSNTPDPEVESMLANHTPRLTMPQPLKASDLRHVIHKLSPTKAPGPDLITAQMIQELPPSGSKILLKLYNAILRMEYWPTKFKQARVIMILKPGKPPTDVSSYRPISLLSIISKILEKLLLRRLLSDPYSQDWIPPHQFGFRKAHTTIQQCHRLTTLLNKTLEDRQYCSAVFLDISQAFDKVWHQGLLLKIQQTLPPTYFNILKSYLQSRQLVVTYNSSTSKPVHMHSGVPQGSVLGPFLYTIYTADIPQSPFTTLGTFADDTAILSNHPNPITASAHLQTHLQSIEKWTRKWRIKINEGKSKHVTFTLRRGNCPPLTLNQTIIPQADTVKYLGLHLDRRLTWNCHISTLRKRLDLRTKELYWIIGKHSPLSLSNKLLIYKTILKPAWTYGIELWGCASPSNIAIIQRYQSKLLRLITNAPWYVTNQTLHQDLSITTVRHVFRDKVVPHHKTLSEHPNPPMGPLADQPEQRRLKRSWTFDGII
jgi:hypothetical protein